jgi:ABC-type phosphate transport system substrate-binding protein
MRIAKSIFVGSLAALVLVAAPALAKNSDSQKTEDKQASASCQAYQLAPDGSWTPLPCGEMVAKAPQKNTVRGTDQRAR